MATELKMPALSPTMEEGTLAKWLVKEGDTVKSGDIMAEIETDKATMEFEAVDEGTIADQDAKQRAVGIGLELHRRLVGLDLRQDVALLEGVARLLQPAGDGALLHRVAEARHRELFGHPRLRL